jgi:uncharacterized protein involved in exopolysaccharide biosynthesis
MTKRDLLIFLFKWKTTLFGYLCFIVGLVTILVYIFPPFYLSRAIVVIERNRAPDMRTATLPGLEMVEVMNTEADIALSRTVLSRAVDRLNLYNLPKIDGFGRRLGKWIDDGLINMGLVPPVGERERWIRTLMSWADAEPLVNSNAMYIKYWSDDPELGSRIVNAVTDAYIEHHLEVYLPKGSSDFYRSQILASEEELNTIRRDITAFKEQVNVAAIDQNKQQFARDLGTLRQQLTEENSRLADVLFRYKPDHPLSLVEKFKITALEAQIRLAERKLQDLDAKEGRINELEVNYRAKEAAYTSLKQRYEDARTAELANPDTINVRLAEYAPVPNPRPRFSRLFFIMISVVVGLLVAILIAMVHEYFDHRVQNPEDAEGALGVPVLGSIERLPRRRLNALRRKCWSASLSGDIR